MTEPDINYSPYIAVSGEGVRFGLTTCLRCGAAVLVEPGEDRAGEHDRWHAAPSQEKEGKG